VRRNLIVWLMVACLGAVTYAASIERPLADTVQEALAREIFHELKCVVCEGQSLAESDAVLARQMRERVRELVAAGQSRPQILAYFTATYGDTIRMTPPFTGRTVLLWALPLLLLAVGVGIVRGAIARQPREES